MTTPTLQQRLIKYEQLIPCQAAFIDAKTPGSHLKDNYSIIGMGVTESRHQKVNLAERHGFCIGAAGQPPNITNSPHSHYTAEVFMVFSSNWRFYWNNDCNAETVLYPGDIISLPTNMFRGFENVGDRYGMIFSILGHDDSGGGVIWSPRVIEEAKGHGLILLENGKLIDTTIGETVPESIQPMPILTSEELKQFDQYTLEEMQQHVGSKAHYTTSPYTGFANQTPDTLSYYDIIGPLDSKEHRFQVTPGDKNGDGFNVYGLVSSGIATTGKYARAETEVLLVQEGSFTIECSTEHESIHARVEAGDIMSFPKHAPRTISGDGHGFAHLIVGGDYPKHVERMD